MSISGHRKDKSLKQLNIVKMFLDNSCCISDVIRATLHARMCAGPVRRKGVLKDREYSVNHLFNDFHKQTGFMLWGNLKRYFCTI